MLCCLYEASLLITQSERPSGALFHCLSADILIMTQPLFQPTVAAH